MREARTSWGGRLPPSPCGSLGVTDAGRADSAGGAAFDTRRILRPGHVVPGDLGRARPERAGELVEIRRARTPAPGAAERPRRGHARRRSSRSVSWKYTCVTAGSAARRISARARSPSECVVGSATRRRARGKQDPGRRRQPPPTARRPAGTADAPAAACSRRIRATAQASATSASVYQPPPQKRRRRETLFPHPPALAENALAGRDVAARPGVVGRRPVRVVTERARVAASTARSSQARASSPAASSGGRMSAAIAKPPGVFAGTPRSAPTPRSSSGRSTWQETTAYRSRDVALIRQEVSSPSR